VFVGYGIRAPEWQWDDYKGTDLRGKVLLNARQRPGSRRFHGVSLEKF